MPYFPGDKIAKKTVLISTKISELIQSDKSRKISMDFTRYSVSQE